MKNKLKNLMELNRDPMLVVRGGQIVCTNSAAQSAFPDVRSGDSAKYLLPGKILENPSERFVASACIGGLNCVVFSTVFDNDRLFALHPLKGKDNTGVLSAAVMVRLQSTLSILCLATDKLASSLERKGDTKLLNTVTILRHSNFTFRRQLGNMDAAMLLRQSRMLPRMRNIDLVELCGNLVETVSALTGKHAASIRFITKEKTVIVNADARKVERILLNLLSNSLAHTSAEGMIKLRLSKRGKNALLSVTDNGDGISEKEMKSLFSNDENEADDMNLSQMVSARLGLKVSSGLTQLHGGTLLIESRVGVGTTVNLTLPLGDLEFDMETGGMELNRMNDILTELSDVLDTEHYSPKNMD